VPADGDELRWGGQTLARAGKLRPGWGPGPGAASHVLSTAPARGLPEHQHGTHAWPPGARCRHLAGVEGRKGMRQREMQGCAGGRCMGAPSMRDSRGALAGDAGVSRRCGTAGVSRRFGAGELRHGASSARATATLSQGQPSAGLRQRSGRGRAPPGATSGRAGRGVARATSPKGQGGTQGTGRAMARATSPEGRGGARGTGRGMVGIGSGKNPL
jgi:hypothetical protein